MEHGFTIIAVALLALQGSDTIFVFGAILIAAFFMGAFLFVYWIRYSNALKRQREEHRREALERTRQEQKSA